MAKIVGMTRPDTTERDRAIRYMAVVLRRTDREIARALDCSVLTVERVLTDPPPAPARHLVPDFKPRPAATITQPSIVAPGMVSVDLSGGSVSHDAPPIMPPLETVNLSTQ